MASVGGFESQIMIIVLLVWNIGLTIAVAVLSQRVGAKPKPPEPIDKPEEEKSAE